MQDEPARISHQGCGLAHYAADARPMGMRNGALAFSLGVVAVHWSPWAHPLWACWLGLGVALLVPRRARTLAAAVLGLGWGALHAVGAVDVRIDRSCSETTITGRIVDLPALSEPVAPGTPRARRFVVHPQTAGCAIDGPVRLSWYDGPKVRGGERWRLIVPAPGTPGNGQYPWIRHRQMVRAQSGRGHGVRSRGNPGRGRSMGSDHLRPSVVRERLRDRIGDLALANHGVVTALTIGDAGGDSKGRHRPLPAYRDYAPARHFRHACRRRHRVRVPPRSWRGPTVGRLA